MSIDSQRDLLGMRHAGRVVAQTLAKMRAAIRAGMSTAELDAIAGQFLAQHGARPAPQLHVGFPAATCISVNEQAVHGLPSSRQLQPGDLVKLDVAAELNGYVADAAITVILPPAAPQAIRLRDCALRALQLALQAATAGRLVNQIGRAIEDEVRRHGMFIVPELTGHGVGRAMWEAPRVPNFCDTTSQDQLTDGLVLAIEPIVALGSPCAVQMPDGWTIRTADRSLAAHVEHTVLITRGRPVVLTAI